MPQLATLFALPQRSVPVSVPHAAPSREQNAQLLSPGHEQTPALQLLPAAQLPQLVTVRCLPQLSVAVTPPQALPRRAHSWASVSDVQAHFPAWQLLCFDR